MAKSIIQSRKECIVCHQKNNLELHHCLHGKNRKQADEDGLTVWLCVEHHRGTTGVHGRNYRLDLELKQIAQRKYEETHTREEWMNRYHKNYLD